MFQRNRGNRRDGGQQMQMVASSRCAPVRRGVGINDAKLSTRISSTARTAANESAMPPGFGRRWNLLIAENVVCRDRDAVTQDLAGNRSADLKGSAEIGLPARGMRRR